MAFNGFNSGPSSDVQRDSFNAAYSSLEQTIRNFSKEKLMYEQTIDNLKSRIANDRQSLQKLSAEHQEQVADYQRLLDMLEENDENRVNVNALIASVERKLEIISGTVHEFERMGCDMFGRYEAVEEFSYCLKFRQLQLLQWIREKTTLIAQLEESKMELEEARKMLGDHCSRLESQNNDLMKQLHQQIELFESATTKLEEAKCAIASKLSEMTALKEALADEKKALVDEKEVLSTQLEKAKMDLEEAEKIMSDQCSRLEDQNNALAKQLEEKIAFCESTTAKLEEEKGAITSNLSEMTALNEGLAAEKKALLDEKEVLVGQLEKSKMDLEEAKKTMGDQCSSLEDQINVLAKQLEEKIASFESATTKLEEEKGAIASKLSEMTAEKDVLVAEKGVLVSEKEVLVAAKEALADEKKALEDEKEVLSTQLEKSKMDLEDAKKAMGDQCSKLEDENNAIIKQLQEKVASCESTITKLQEEKTAIASNLSEMTVVKEGLAAEKEVHVAQLEKLKLDSDESTTTLNDQCSKLEEQNNGLLNQLQEKNVLLDSTTAKFEEEKGALIGELEETKKQHGKAMQKVSDVTAEYEDCKHELRALFKRYQDQKMAIDKLITDTGSRPISLPKSRALSKKTVNDTVSPVASTMMKVPSTPSTRRIQISDPPTPSRPSILKRPTQDSDSGKPKNVSFGQVEVNAFAILSGSSDSDTISPSKDGSGSKVSADSVKRKKIAPNKETDSGDTETTDSVPDDDPDYVPTKPKRQYRHKISIRSPLSTSY